MGERAIDVARDRSREQAVNRIQALRKELPSDWQFDRDESCGPSRALQLLFDGLSVASALRAGSETIWSDDMQDGMVIDSRVHISNPFRTGS